ncbi:Arginyl-tRNA--protein transferase 1 [Microbotryomycetes sp. JL221]|nr:Arginyl-tRNA--protein transferase 1 [Microbotryomycetes sp. JL221]
MSSLASSSLSSSHDTASSSSARGGDDQGANAIMSILQPLGYVKGSCGYCKPKNGKRRQTARSYGCWAHVLSCSTYRALLDRGWRRSGSYMYKPDMRATCCPQYTISLEAGAFSPSKSQRQLLHRFANMCTTGARYGTPGWGQSQHIELDTFRDVKYDSLLSTAKSVTFNPSSAARLDDDEESRTTRHFARLSGSEARKGDKLMVADGDSPANSAQLPRPRGTTEGKGKTKGKGKAPPMTLEEMVHEGEWDPSKSTQKLTHNFRFVLEEASFTEEKFQLFRRYQTRIHQEPDSKVTRKGFQRFLVDSPLEIEPTAVAGYNYGSHHGLYYVNNELIALAVLDILPGAVSSVYLAWDPAWHGIGLGKLSALREIAMVREMRHAGLHDMKSYMMGFYIHSCPKMKYKGEYHPSSLLDPSTGDAGLTSSAASSMRVDKSEDQSITSGSQGSDDDDDSDESDEKGDDDTQWPNQPPPGCLDPHKLPKSLLLESTVLEHRMLVPLLFSSAWHDSVKQAEIRQLLAAVGDNLASHIAIYVG